MEGTKELGNSTCSLLSSVEIGKEGRGSRPEDVVLVLKEVQM